MKSLSNAILVVLVTASLAAVARADTLYVVERVDRDTSTGGGYWSTKIEAYDWATGDVVASAAFSTADTVKVEGLALSPDGSILYVSDRQSMIRTYNPATGELLDGSFVALPSFAYGLVCDSAGNIYASMKNKSIAKITPAGVVNTTWGDPPSRHSTDLEIHGNTLYGAMESDGVATYDLDVGGSPTTLGGASSKICGFAMAPNDTIYSVPYDGEAKIFQWEAPYTSGTQTALSSTTFIGPRDIDYVDGALYVGSMGGVYKYDLLTDIRSTLVDLSGGSYPLASQLELLIPEPGTFVLLATGLIGLLCYAWRKRR